MFLLFLYSIPTAFLLLIIKTKFKFLALIFGLFYILVADLLISGIIIWPFHFQADHTILANKHVSNAILTHQQDALYLPFPIRSLLFNSSVYFYFLFTHAFSFLSLKNLADIFLLANLYPLTLGFFKLIHHPIIEKIFFVGSLFITIIILGFSRSVPENYFFIVIAPILLYLIVLGFKSLDIKLYLVLSILTTIIQINILL